MPSRIDWEGKLNVSPRPRRLAISGWTEDVPSGLVGGLDSDAMRFASKV